MKLLEEEMATHSSILAWRIPWTEEPGKLQVHGVAELDTTERLTFSLHYEVITNCDVKYCHKSQTNVLSFNSN